MIRWRKIERDNSETWGPVGEKVLLWLEYKGNGSPAVGYRHEGNDYWITQFASVGGKEPWPLYWAPVNSPPNWPEGKP